MVIDDLSRKNTIQILKHIQAEKGFKKLTEIQKKAYPRIFSNSNLVVVAPSGAGKTLIAELIALKDLISDKNLTTQTITKNYSTQSKNETEICSAKTIFLVPLRALAEEKASSLVRDYRHFNLKIHMSMSEIDFNEEEIRECNILISTYERFRTIIGRMPNLIAHVKNVIVDEFHLLGNQNRGPVLEAILTTLLGKVRLILLSATIANPEDVAKWLDAILVISANPLPVSLRCSWLSLSKVPAVFIRATESICGRRLTAATILSCTSAVSITGKEPIMSIIVFNLSITHDGVFLFGTSIYAML